MIQSNITTTGNMKKDVDIISTLPNDLLCRILSLLPSKDAMGTSVLSSRWKNIIDFVPILDITCNVPTPGFINTLDKLFSSTSSSSNLQKLRLQIHDFPWFIVPGHVNSWIRSAINRKVNSWIRSAINRKVVDLDVRLPYFVSDTVENHEGLAVRVIASDSLQTLNISGGLGLHMPYTTGCFKNLKTFRLYIKNPDKEILAKLFCSLPQLETLLIDANFSKIMGRDMNMCINIIAPALKWLDLCINQEDYHDVDFKVLIDTPMLENVMLEDDYLAAYSLMSGPFLVKATLEVGLEYYHEDHIDNGNRYVHAVELIRALSNVKSLSFGYGTSAALGWAGQDLPILHDLTHLKMDDMPLTGLTLIPMFLQSAPNLKVFGVTIQPEVEFIRGWSWKSPTTLPNSLLHLEVFKIQGAEIIKRDPSFPVMVNYIANNAKVLKEFTIDGKVDWFSMVLSCY